MHRPKCQVQFIWQKRHSCDDAGLKKRLKIECCGAVDLEGIISDENIAPMPAPLFSCAPDDHVSKSTSELEHAKHIDIPETMENNRNPYRHPFIISVRESNDDFSWKGRKQRPQGKEATLTINQGATNGKPIYQLTLTSPSVPLQKNRFSIKSSDSELAVARLVSHHSIGVGDAKYS